MTSEITPKPSEMLNSDFSNVTILPTEEFKR